MIRRLVATAILSAQGVSAAPSSLVPGVPVTAALAGGERASYTVSVPADKAARLVLRQEGIDVSVAIGAPGAIDPKRALDLATGPDGEEIAIFPIADRDRVWEVAVSASLPRSPRASYVVSLEMTPADDRARVTAEGWSRFVSGWEAAWGGDLAAFSKALQHYSAAIADANRGGDTSLPPEAMYQAARVHDHLGEFPQAIELLQRATALFESLGRRDRQARVLNRLGDLSRKVGEVEAAEQFFAEAMPLAREARDPETIVDILNNSGLLMNALGRAEEAILQLQDAIPLAQEIDSANVETALHFNIGSGYLSLGVHDKAIESYQRAYQIGQRLNLPRRTARHLTNLGMALFESGDRTRAEEALAKALHLYERSGDRTGEAETLSFSGQMLHALGEHDRALTLFARARPPLQAAQARAAEARLLTAWAEVEIERDEIDQALSRLDEASQLATTVADPRLVQRMDYVRARGLEKRDRLAEAVEAAARVTRSIEATRGTLRRQELRTSYVARVRSYFDLHVDLLQRQGASAAAFEMNERGRARTLLDALAESATKIRKGIDPQLLKRERSLHAQINARESYRAQVALKHGERSAQATAVARDVARLVETLRELQATIRVSSPAYWALQAPEPTRVDHVQRTLLDAGSALVEYRLGPDRSYVWVIDRGAITAHPLPPSTRIEAIARRYHELLSREIATLTAAERVALQQDLSVVGARLAAIVWKPIADRVRGRRLVIVADGVLHYVPFAALPGTNGRPLVVAHEIVYLPSASALDSLRQRGRMRAGASAAVFADPVFSRNDPRFGGTRDHAAPAETRAADGQLYGRLRFSRTEAEAIGALEPASLQALDFHAAKDTLVKGGLRRYGILHFATHGVLNSSIPELSGLVLSLVDRKGDPVDGFLRLHEIYNLDLDADLVVLSACRTALGQEVYGEGLIGLTRGFMYAGAARVVSSVWNVDDRATARFMSTFYASMLSKGRAPAAALRDAQLALLNDPRWAQPHYWAAFGLQGDWK
jgi:CHAT domain-containing protein/tetratricopeptide (TPR) repeat protein